MKSLIVLFLLMPFLSFSQVSWKYHVIDNIGSGADGVKLADINSDGKLDITTGWEESGETKIYLQPQLENIKEKWPNVVVGKTPSVEDAVFADMDTDGKLDVVSCTENNSQKIFIHYNRTPELQNEGNWKQVVLPASDGVMSWMYAQPMQVDGKYGTDLVAAGKGENAALGWFEAPEKANNLDDWKWHEISKVGWIMSIIREDMDNDGDLDLLITDRNGKLRGCRWLENPGDFEEQNKPWQNYFIGAEKLEVMFMCICDIGGDNTKEVLLAERTDNSVLIFRKNNNKWTKETVLLPGNTGFAKSVETGDINNDGRIDLVVSTNTLKEEKDALIWLDGRNINSAQESDWQSIAGVLKAKYDKVELIDLDKDGDLDILICEENNGKNSEGLGVVWYENPYMR